MQLLSVLFLLAGLLAQVTNAYVYFLNTNWTGIAATTNYELRWMGDGTPANISLHHGPADNMVFVKNITTNNRNSSMVWNPHDSHATGNYSLVIHQSGFSFSSPRFMLLGVITRVPATMSVVVTVTPSVMTNTGVQLEPSSMPRIVIVGRDGDADADAVSPVVTSAPFVPARSLKMRQNVAGSGSNGTLTNGTAINGTAINGTVGIPVVVEGAAGTVRLDGVVVVTCIVGFAALL